ncbi:MAG: TonB-dependent receptor [Burkholderiaceae bacterium]|jgi:iron complex outermembrane receptor protein|nr:TonB-dependent receptor [Burkholderiaceae bacterium]
MHSRHYALTPIAGALACLLSSATVWAQTAPAAPVATPELGTITVEASADASAEGLSKPYAGGQVARGGRAGILGTRDNMETPFSITSYTNELIQDRQARSVGDVLQNDPTVRVSRGFGNFQEAYFVRGFTLSSDDVAYNGLYSLLPRQYIATELFERVELLRGASTFLMGASPNGGGLGGNINLLPKRAGSEPLSRVTAGVASGGQASIAADVSRRFGPDQSTGIRVNAAHRAGDTSIDQEHSRLDLLSVGMDWRSRDVRLSGDIGWQENRLKRTRTNVTPGTGLTAIPSAPDASSNWAQPWSYSDERDLFGTLRGEWDINSNLTAWAAYGLRRSSENNSLANITLAATGNGAATTSRFDNARKDRVSTGEIGLRGRLQTGSVGHEIVASYSAFDLKVYNAYGMSLGNTLNTNLYNPSYYASTPLTYLGNDLSNPAYNRGTRLNSFALGDTLSMMDGRLLVTAGVRHQTIETDSLTYRVVNNGVVTSPGGVRTAYDQSRTSPVLGAVFKLTPQVSLYGNYIEGLAQGDTAPARSGNTVIVNAGEQMSPYVTKQKEVGVKYDGGKLGGGLAFFSTDKPRSLIDGNRFTSEGKDRHQGLELNLFGEPVRGLRLLGGATWLDAKQDSTGNATTDGKRVIGVPRFQATMGAEWDVPGVKGLTLDGRLVHTGASYANDVNSLRVAGWNRLDLGVRYMTEVQGKLLTLRLRVDNVTDRNYWASVGGYPGSGYMTLGAPRTFSLSASMDF